MSPSSSLSSPGQKSGIKKIRREWKYWLCHYPKCRVLSKCGWEDSPGIYNQSELDTSTTLLASPTLTPTPSNHLPLMFCHLPTVRLNLTRQMLIQYYSNDCLSLGINVHFISLSDCLMINLVPHSNFSDCDKLLVALNSPGMHQLSDLIPSHLHYHTSAPGSC